MHAHRIEVFDRADDDAVVLLVPHHLHLVLFPTQQRLFNQQFVGRRSLQAALADGLELFGVVGNAPARAAKREAGPDHGGETHHLLHLPGLGHAVGNARTRRSQTNFGHGVLEFEAVFGLVDGLGRGTDQLDLVLVEHALAPQVERAVERRLPAHGRQDRVGALLGDDFFHRLPSDRLDIGHIGRGRIGHDRGRVAVDQDDLVTLFAQSLAGLYAGVVELAGLADDDRAGADDEDALKVCAFWHGALLGYFS